jgi:hypothetical protein
MVRLTTGGPITPDVPAVGPVWLAEQAQRAQDQDQQHGARDCDQETQQTPMPSSPATQ